MDELLPDPVENAPTEEKDNLDSAPTPRIKRLPVLHLGGAIGTLSRSEIYDDEPALP